MRGMRKQIPTRARNVKKEKRPSIKGMPVKSLPGKFSEELPEAISSEDFLPANSARARYAGDGFASDEIAPISPISSQRKEFMGKVASDRYAHDIPKNSPSARTAGTRHPGNGVGRHVSPNSPSGGFAPPQSARGRFAGEPLNSDLMTPTSSDFGPAQSTRGRFAGDGVARDVSPRGEYMGKVASDREVMGKVASDRYVRESPRTAPTSPPRKEYVGRKKTSGTYGTRYPGNGVARDVIAPPSPKRPVMGKVASDRYAPENRKNSPSSRNAGLRYPGEGVLRDLSAPIVSPRGEFMGKVPSDRYAPEFPSNGPYSRTAGALVGESPAAQSVGSHWSGDETTADLSTSTSSQRKSSVESQRKSSVESQRKSSVGIQSVASVAMFKVASDRSAVETTFERRANRKPGGGEERLSKSSIQKRDSDEFEAWSRKPTSPKAPGSNETDDGYKKIKLNNHSVFLKVEDEPDEDTRSMKCHCCAYLTRLHTVEIFDLTLFGWEEQQMMDRAGMRPRATQIVCWRRSVLEVSCICYFCNLAYACYDLFWAAVNDRKEFREGKVAGLALANYAKHFKGYIFFKYFFSAATIIGHVFALAFCVIALLRWRTWSHSVRWTCYAYGVGYATPFFLLMVTPFHWGIDMRALQTQFCTDLVNGAPSVDTRVSWGPSKLAQGLKASGLPGTDNIVDIDNTTSKGLRALLEEKGVILPSTEEFCARDPNKWERYVDQMIQDSGLKAEEGKGCRASPMSNRTLVPKPGLPDLTVNVSAGVQKCETAPCERCGTATCLALLPTLQLAVSSAHASSLVFNETGSGEGLSTQRALSQWGLDTNPANKDCFHCVEPLQEVAVSAATGEVPSCAALCLPLWGSGQAKYNASASRSRMVVQGLSSAYSSAARNSRWAMNAAEEAKNVRICVNMDDLTALELLLSFATTTRPIQTILGIREAMNALLYLLPTNFAMMFGALKGSCISKTTVPYSRIPGVIVITAVVFSLPHLATLVILIKSVLGDLSIMCALSFFLVSNLIWLPFGILLRSMGLDQYAGNGLMEPSTHTEAAARIQRRQRFAMVCYILMAVFLVIWFLLSETLRNFLELGLSSYKFRDLQRALFSKWFWRMVGLQGIKLFTSMYGLTKISMIFFADVCVYTLLLVDEGDTAPQDAEFRQEHGEKEQTLCKELHEDFQTDANDLATLSEEFRRLLRGRFKTKGFTKSFSTNWKKLQGFTWSIGAIQNKFSPGSNPGRKMSDDTE